MSYIRCKNCNWSQDDFWDKDGYTPFRKDIVEYLTNCLFQEKKYFDYGFVAEHPDIEWHYEDSQAWCKGTDLVASILMSKARSIRNMKFPTYQSWKDAGKDATCPQCGHQKFTED